MSPSRRSSLRARRRRPKRWTTDSCIGTVSRASTDTGFTTLRPNARIRYTDRLDAPNLPGEMLVEVVLRAVSCGTALEIVQSGIPAAIPAEMCRLGWQQSLSQLALLVEPGIPDGG